MNYHSYKAQVLWAQVDANRHLRHSAYADFGAQARVVMLAEAGLDLASFDRLQLGPILFREELKYMREVPMNEVIEVRTSLLSARPNASRWTILHEIYCSDGILAATIIADGAWLDTTLRKLAQLPEGMGPKFLAIPKHEDYKEQ